MLILKDIKKDYITGDTVVNALKGINLQFRKSEFVSILGPSGCGKTTLLNIVGGLDKYTSGDLVIDGISTKDYTDREWDTYRNKRIGFVFQNYNLIMHLSVLANVELALTLSGIDSAERKKRASEALIKVGLKDQMNKKPNQLSGGQMQRVAIARALVNNPDILLADEPTGALDSTTSVQIMDLLKEVASDRLIIMVTHNGELAKKYSTRIISFIDGEILSDTNPYECVESKNGVSSEENAKNKKADKVKLTDAEKAEIKAKKKERRLTSMSFWTALKLSFTNLKSKKGRTITTSIAGSIGIIGVALVLAVSNGFTAYIGQMQTDALSTYPLQVSERFVDVTGETQVADKGDPFPDSDEVAAEKQKIDYTQYIKQNVISQDVVDHVESMDENFYSAVKYNYGLKMNIAMKKDNDVRLINNDNIKFTSMIGDTDFIKTQYDLQKGGAYPTNENEIFLIINKYNELPVNLLTELGFSKDAKVKFSDIVGLELKVVHNDNFYINNNDGTFSAIKSGDGSAALNTMYSDSKNINLKIVGILRVKESNTLSTMGTGLYYMSSLVDTVYESFKETDIASAQIANTTTNLVTGKLFANEITNIAGGPMNPNFMTVVMTLMTSPGTIFSFTPNEAYKNALNKLGAEKRVTNIDIYPKDFNKKEEIKVYLESYNGDKADNLKITVVDNAATMTDMMTQLVNVITIALVVFAGISLVVSSVMIGVITYVSVVERTKEIGILRSIGARKKDISRVFNAETFIIGLLAGFIGVIFTYILSIPINLIVAGLVDITGIAQLTIIAALILIVVSVGLTMIAGLVPSKLAAKKDPVVALRSE